MKRKDNSFAVVSTLLKTLNVPVTMKSVRNEMDRHPDPDSLLAISEVLTQFRVPNGAFNVSLEDLSSVPTPFIIHLRSKNKPRGGFAVVQKADHVKISMVDKNGIEKSISNKDLEDLFTGTILIAENSEGAGEKDYSRKRREERVAAISPLLVLFGVIALWLLSAVLWYNTGLVSKMAIWMLLLKSAGVVVTTLLLMFSFNARNPLLQKLCAGSRDRQCHSILNSKAAQLTPWLSWSELGFFYYTGSLLVLLFIPDMFQLLTLLSLLSTPFIFYSLHHQWLVARQWCTLCLLVVGLQIQELIIAVIQFSPAVFWASAAQWTGLIMAFFAPVLAWTFLKPIIQKARELEPLQYRYNRMKYDTQLFRQLLMQTGRRLLPAENDSIMLGNVQAKTTITMVSNPYCPPCSRAHKFLAEWISLRDDLRLQVIFAVNQSDSDPGYKMASHVMALQQDRGSGSIDHALHEWYDQEQKDFVRWARQFPTSVNSDPAMLERQKDWCKLNEVTATPTILINGYKLPEAYQPSDIKYLV